MRTPISATSDLEGIGNPPDASPPAGLNWDLWLGPAPTRPFNPNRFGVYPNAYSYFRYFRSERYWQPAGRFAPGGAELGPLARAGPHAPIQPEPFRRLPECVLLFPLLLGLRGRLRDRFGRPHDRYSADGARRL